MTSQPSARIILDSIHPDGISRVTTLELTCHRFVLAELNTHRAFSRNSASSRAIPLAKQIERVKRDPAIPVSFPAEQKGMQGGEEIEEPTRTSAELRWLRARDRAIEAAESLGMMGVHKSVCNRLLEPFMWQTIIVTATEWDNFWKLRCSPMAQPEIRVAAEAMKEAYDASTPTPLRYGDWHLPLTYDYDFFQMIGHWGGEVGLENAKKISAARCARVSYLTHDGRRDWDADLKLAERLINPGDGAMHSSPFEHVCTPAENEFEVFGNEIRYNGPEGNLRRWRQFRHDIERDIYGS